MADTVTFSVDGERIVAEGDRLVRAYLSAGTAAVAGATRATEQRLEDATRRAIPGKLWRAWKSSAFPASGPARAPAGNIFLNGRDRTLGALRFWTEPGAIRGKRDQYLAIPLPAAGSRGRLRDLTPGEWERRTGIRLTFVYRPGRASLLVAENAVLSGRGQIARANTAKRVAAGRGSASVPIFVLLPMVPFKNTLAVQPILQASEGELTRQFFEAIRTIS